MTKVGAVLQHEHITRLDIMEGFSNPEKKRANEGKGRVCARCGLALSNYRIMMSGADIAARESRS